MLTKKIRLFYWTMGLEGILVVRKGGVGGEDGVWSYILSFQNGFPGQLYWPSLCDVVDGGSGLDV